MSQEIPQLRKNCTGSGRISIGVDIGGTSIKLVRLRGNQVEEAIEFATPIRAGANQVLDSLAHAIARLLRPRERRAKTLSVGIAVPGFLDDARAEVVHLSNLPALNGVPVQKELKKRIGGNIVLDTDTNAALLAETKLGAGHGFDRVLYVTLGTGLGAALAIGGEPVRVSHHTMGQVAHVPIASAGPLCHCGSRGCAETLLSAQGILWRAGRAGLGGISSPEELWELCRSRSSSFSKAQAAAEGGAPRFKAARIWMETGELLGRLLRILGTLFAPNVVVLGGGISGAARLFLPRARSYLKQCFAPALGAKLPLRPARLGRHAGAVGAALFGARSAGP